MNNKKVSIVVPVYNMADSIEECVKSLVNQDYGNYEIILVDDGSKDDSLERCNNLKRENTIIQVYHTENRGSGPARNHGIDHACGRYIFFPDADDILEKHAISRLVEAMENGNNDLVVFGYREIRPDGALGREKKYPDLHQNGDDIRAHYAEYMGSTVSLGIQGAPWNKFFDLEVVKNNNVRFPPLRRHQDEGFIARYMCYAQHVHFIQDVLYTHFTNDLKLQWKKYPVDYIDAVIGLNETRKETILKWNPDDVDTHVIIQREYICNVIKALELSFSPKMGFNSKKERIAWITDKLTSSGIRDVCIPANLGKYQRYIMGIIKSGNTNRLYHALHFKVRVEMSALYRLIR